MPSAEPRRRLSRPGSWGERVQGAHGRYKVTQLPPSGGVSRTTPPQLSCAIRGTVASPKPVPVPAGLVVKKPRWPGFKLCTQGGAVILALFTTSRAPQDSALSAVPERARRDGRPALAAERGLSASHRHAVARQPAIS